MSGHLEDAALLAAISRALPHVEDPRADTQRVIAFPAPDGSRLVVLYDAWEFHMGATTEKVALVDHGARVLRLFPFEAVSTGAHVCEWRADGAVFALSLGTTVLLWALAEQRFAFARPDFTPSSIAFEADGLRVRKSTYRAGKGGGYYADGPAGARFGYAALVWHEASALDRHEELALAVPQAGAGPLG